MNNETLEQMSKRFHKERELEYKEAKELAKKCLKYYGSDSSASEHLARLALMNNESQEAFLHIRNGK